MVHVCWPAGSRLLLLLRSGLAAGGFLPHPPQDPHRWWNAARTLAYGAPALSQAAGLSILLAGRRWETLKNNLSSDTHTQGAA